MAYTEERVKFGFKNLYLAPKATGWTRENPTYDTPIKQEGATTFEPELQQEITKFFADDSLYFKMTKATSYDGPLTVAKYNDAIRTGIMGDIKDADGMIYDVDGAVMKEFAIMGERQTDQGGLRFVFYSASGSKPNETMSTLEEGAAEIPTEAMDTSCTSVKVPTAEGVKPVYAFGMKVREGHPLYNDFFTAVAFGDPIVAGA